LPFTEKARRHLRSHHEPRPSGRGSAESRRAPKLEDIINKALEKDRTLRYQHASRYGPTCNGSSVTQRQDDLQLLVLVRCLGAGRQFFCRPTAVASICLSPDLLHLRHRVREGCRSFCGSAGETLEDCSSRLLLACSSPSRLEIWYWRSRLRRSTPCAVLPFVNTSGDANNDYLSDGISEGVMHSLSQLPQLSRDGSNLKFSLQGS